MVKKINNKVITVKINKYKTHYISVQEDLDANFKQVKI